MEIKKNPEVDLRTYRTIFSLLGLSVALGLVLGIFHYTQYKKQAEATLDMEYYEEELEVEQTYKEKPPEQKREQPPELEIAPDEEELPEQPPLPIPQDPGDPLPPPPPPSSGPDETGEALEFWEVSKKAKFKGDLDEFIKKNLVYPPIASEEGIEGRVMVEFIVGSNGKIDCNSITIKSRAIGFGLEEEAKKVICKSREMWEAAEQRDHKVPMKYRQPIRFQLQ